MIEIKTDQEIAIMAKGGKILAETLFAVVQHVRPGVTELELDALAEKLIRSQGGEPAFQFVPGYHHTICASTNDVVVHGIPSQYVLKEGDIIGIDCGVKLGGFNTDMSESVIVGGPQTVDKKVADFVDTGKKALDLAIEQIKPGNHVGDVSHVIQMIVEGAGYSVVRELIGHGVGRQLHEEPEVPGYVKGAIEKTPLLKEGMVIAVEVIYNMGKKEVEYAGNHDNWTIVTTDGSLSGLFERSIAVTKSGYKILT